jgi:hypothetical protein
MIVWTIFVFTTWGHAAHSPVYFPTLAACQAVVDGYPESKTKTRKCMQIVIEWKDKK